MKTKTIGKKLLASLGAMLVSSIGMAQVDVESNNLFSKVDKLIDGNKKLASKVDTNYIKTPCQPWQVSVTSRVSQTDLQMHSIVDGGELFDGEGSMPFIRGVGDMATDPRIMTKVSTSLGVKVGYKGLSASYSFPIGGDKSQNITLKSAGRWYAVNLRWHKFKTKTVRTHYAGAVQGREVEDYDEATEDFKFSDWGESYGWDETEKEQLPSNMTIKTLIFDGFYIFNHKKFSYAAAYNQKTIQARSAGSPIAGVMGYYADFKYNDPRNAELIYWMDGIGRLRQYQLAVGAGYAYNFVPAKGWLISAMAMPMLTMVNRTRINTYNSNFKDLAKDNLLAYIIVEAMKEEGVEGLDDVNFDFSDDCEIQSTGVHSRNNRLALNFTTRLSVTYNWKRYFVNANGQFNNFNYKHRRQHGHLNDWYINASIGVRL
ncbi:MAG: DUF4421 family protein [Bacteroidaceae bacterium]|nr:DUF4421 family protein [Bacteroidaceae bacterium]